MSANSGILATDLDGSLAPKRKRDAEVEQSATPKKKKKKNKHAVDGKFDHIDESLQIDRTIANMEGRLIADHISQQLKRFIPDLSPIELEDLRLPEYAFDIRNDWTASRASEGLAAFVELLHGKSKAEVAKLPVKRTGSPHTIVITAAGLRAADLARILRVFQTDSSSVAKLFAKHIKLKQAVESANKTRMGIGVGTPQRLRDLVEHGALSLEATELIILDASHVNEKKKGIFDMPELVKPLAQFLGLKVLKQRYTPNSIPSEVGSKRRTRIAIF